MISRWKCSWRLASSTRVISFSWQKSRTLSRSMRSSSLNASSSRSGSCQSKTGFPLDREGIAAAACGFIVFTPMTLADAVGFFVGHQRRRFDLYLGAVLEEGNDLDQRHGGKMTTERLAPDAADLGQAGEVLALVGDVPGHACDMVRPGARRREHGDRVAQRLLHLADEVVGREGLRFAPADLAGDEDETTAPGHAVGVALGLRPSRRVDLLQPARGARCGWEGRAGSGRHGGVDS